MLIPGNPYKMEGCACFLVEIRDEEGLGIPNPSFLLIYCSR